MRIWYRQRSGLTPAHGYAPSDRGGPSFLMTTATTTQTLELVTFDLYDTLIELHPPRWERLARACAAIGLETTVDALRDADRVAEDFYTQENGASPIRGRSRDEREAFRIRH